MNATNELKTTELKTTAFELGFELCGVAPAEQPKTFDAFERWINNGQHAGMNYLAEKCSARKHPNSVLQGVQSILMLGVSFATVLNSEYHPVQQLTGVAEYARGIDYHHWIRQRLRKLETKYLQLFPNSQCRGVVDTAPILEKQFAVEAGLGKIGYNTLLINPQYGSKIFLAALLSTQHLQNSQKEQPSNTNSSKFNTTNCHTPASQEEITLSCNNCQRCLTRCPTQALVKPFVLDARRCLNYWTIEHHGKIPEEIQNNLHQLFFGCDICVNVCPHNQHCTTLPKGTINPKSLNTEILFRIAAGSPLERMFR
ncbi:MAG: DUF1730 domain-containing protein [Planctomycetaceae bacterium]|jgi:epoxyqueuosine reductase|nr:DUF1730 domain-containing protein [Planctomycetaceae bacterium]